MAQLTSTILASMGKAKGMEINDTTWNSITQHSLDRIEVIKSMLDRSYKKKQLSGGIEGQVPLRFTRCQAVNT